MLHELGVLLGLVERLVSLGLKEVRVEAEIHCLRQGGPHGRSGSWQHAEVHVLALHILFKFCSFSTITTNRQAARLKPARANPPQPPLNFQYPSQYT